MHKVLVIAAHPDDDILGCGGFIIKSRLTTQFRVVFLAEGTTCRYSIVDSAKEPALAALASRTADARAALALIGVTDVVFHDLPCGRLDQEPILELNRRIELEIAQFRPDTIFTHSEHDTNNDHRIVYRSVQMATRPGGLNHVSTLFSFEIQSSSEWNFTVPFAANHFEELTEEQIGLKWNALASYASEVRPYPHPRSKEGVCALARYRGMQAGVPFAEAYRLIRRINK